MTVQQVNWCREICERTGTDFGYFIDQFLILAPRTLAEANEIMDKLLYKSWSSDYDRMWNNQIAKEFTV